MWSTSAQKKFWTQLGIVLAVWTGLAVVFTGQGYLLLGLAIQARQDLDKVETKLDLTEIFLSTIAECLIWAILTFGIIWLARRFPIGPGKWLRSLPIHIVACLLCSVLAIILAGLMAELIRHGIPKPTHTGSVLLLFVVAKLNNNIIFYTAILAVAMLLNYYRQIRERELTTSQLEAKLAQTQLQILKMQLHPHFLFNTLNAISALIHQDVELADRMIARLGDLLRASLENANQQEVAFKQELDFIQPYLEIEKARLGTRLTVDVQVDPAVMDALVPNLILQPLVENAIRHGVAARPGPGRIQIQAGRENGCLRLTVSDDGPGLQGPCETLKGIGLTNTRARLAKLYGSKHRLDLSNGPQGGLQVDITIPYQDAFPSPVAETP
jgi:two-component system LytT family sensor kinase